MVKKDVTVINPSGLHLRPAAELSRNASQCKSKVTILYGNKTCNAKSSLNIMALTMKKGAQITVVCEGETEAEDLEKITKLIESGLGEI